MKFSQKMPVNFLYTMVQKSQKWPKTQIKGLLPYWTMLSCKTISLWFFKFMSDLSQAVPNQAVCNHLADESQSRCCRIHSKHISKKPVYWCKICFLRYGAAMLDSKVQYKKKKNGCFVLIISMFPKERWSPGAIKSRLSYRSDDRLKGLNFELPENSTGPVCCNDTRKLHNCSLTFSPILFFQWKMSRRW